MIQSISPIKTGYDTELIWIICAFIFKSAFPLSKSLLLVLWKEKKCTKTVPPF